MKKTLIPARKADFRGVKFWPLLVFATIGLGIAGCQQPGTPQAEPKSASIDKASLTEPTKPVALNGTNPANTPESTSANPIPPISDEAWLISAGSHVGKITSHTTLADLEKLYGKANVKAGDVPGPEDTTLAGAIVFPHEPTKKLTVYWKGSRPSAGKGNPSVETVVIDETKSLWHTEEGIKIGTTLKELEKLNGKPFTLSGLDWDYGGMVLSWGDEGKLRDKFQKSGSLGLQLAAPQNAKVDYSSVEGEKTFSSSNPTLQKLNPQVVSISVFLH